MSGMPKLASIEQKRFGSTLKLRALPPEPKAAAFSSAGSLPIIGQLHRVDGTRVELPFEKDFVYQHFLQAVNQSLGSLEQIEEVTSGRYAYVSLGGPNGADLIGPEGLHSPPGWDRAYVVNLDAFSAFCAKGVGFARRARDAYQNQTYGLQESEAHLPFDINPQITCIDHIVVGGNNYSDLASNAKGAYEMLKLAYGLGIERGGIVLPLSIVMIKSFPVPRRDKQGKVIKDEQGNISWENMAGWNYFTNPEVFPDKGKLLRVARYVKNQASAQQASSHQISSRIIQWICNRYIRKVETGERVSKLLRFLVGRAFMKYFAPAAYHYMGDSFRIGNAYRQLISNGYGFFEKGLVEQGLISDSEMQIIKNRAAQKGLPPIQLVDQKRLKAYMDKVLSVIYKPAGVIVCPDKTHCDLGTEKGRIAYLQEVRKMNPEKAEYITRMIMQEIATQLGILHGVGGNGGGHMNMHPLGRINMILEDRETGKIVYADMKLEADGCITQLSSDREGQQKIEGKIDLRGYRIVSMEADNHGDYERGAPGGGVVRPDNLGFGLRDLHSIYTSPSFVSRLIRRYPTNLHGLEIGEAVYHFHCKIIQEAEMNLLFARNLGEQIGGKLQRVAGAVHQLNEVFGGGEEGLSALENTFWEVYNKWSELSMRKYTRESYQEVEDNRPIYIIRGSYRKKDREQELEQYLDQRLSFNYLRTSDEELREILSQGAA